MKDEREGTRERRGEEREKVGDREHSGRERLLLLLRCYERIYSIQVGLEHVWHNVQYDTLSQGEINSSNEWYTGSHGWLCSPPCFFVSSFSTPAWHTIYYVHVCVYIYKDRAAPPIGGPALDDSGVKTLQWREREGHDSYQEVEVYIYI